MRYAVPVSDGCLADHFGHCEEFALLDVDVDRRTVIRTEMVAAPPHQPGLLPPWLAEEGVSVVIARGMGIRARDLFEENRVQVVTGALGENPEQVVLGHLKGTLALGENICDH